MEQKQKQKILIVDNESDELILLIRILSKCFDVYTAESSIQATIAMDENIFSAVLVDVGLGLENGFTVARALKEADLNMAVIIMTGAVINYRHSMPGFDDYIVKGNEENLIGVVLNAIYKKTMPHEIRLRRLRLLNNLYYCKEMISDVFLRTTVNSRNGQLEKLVGKFTQDDKFHSWNVYQLKSKQSCQHVFKISAMSTIGCIGGCLHCKHGGQSLIRLLDWREIVGQALYGLDSLLAQGVFEKIKKVTPCFNFTGMGEPLSNLSNVLEAIRRLARVHGLDFQFIITTIGLEKDLKALLVALDSLDMDLSRIKVYISLNSPDPLVREDLMKVTRGQKLLAIRDLSLKIGEKTGNTTTTSMTVIPDKNDRDEDVRLLAEEWGMTRIKLQAFAPSPGFTPYPVASDLQLEDMKTKLEHADAKDVRIKVVIGGSENSGCGSTTVDEELL